MQEEGRWTGLDAHLPRDLRLYLEERFWQPIEAQATLEVLRDDPSFFADPGRHPAMFADHGVVHVRDVADGLVRLVDTVDGILLAPRPPDRRRFIETYGVAAAYLHDIGMVDMSPIGRRTHPVYAAHAAFWPEVDPLVRHLLAPGPVRERLDHVAETRSVRGAARDGRSRDAQPDRGPQQVDRSRAAPRRPCGVSAPDAAHRVHEPRRSPCRRELAEGVGPIARPAGCGCLARSGPVGRVRLAGGGRRSAA